MAKSGSRAIDFGIYIAARMLAALACAVPFSSAVWASGIVMMGLMKIFPRRVEIARDNLRHSFPDKSGAWIENVVVSMYRHFGRSIVELFRGRRMINARNWREFVDFGSPEQQRRLSEALDSKRAIILFTAHVGNWEMTSYCLDLMGLAGNTIARPMNNPYLERWVRRVRESSGQRMIAKNGEIGAIEKVLRNGQILKVLGDQDAGPRGLFVPFFGRAASTHRSVALFAMRYNALIVVGAAGRVNGHMKFRMYLEDVIDPLDYKGLPQATAVIMSQSIQGLERIIRRHPEQYLWTHRRWKHQPPNGNTASRLDFPRQLAPSRQPTSPLTTSPLTRLVRDFQIAQKWARSLVRLAAWPFSIFSNRR